VADKSELLHLPDHGRSSIVLSETLSSLVARARKDLASLSRQVSKEVEPSDADAQFELGLKYYRADGLPYDKILAEFWFRKAADQDHTRAQFWLGLLRLVEADYVSAVALFRIAAQKDYDRAQYELGLRYFFGEGVGKDEEQAAFWCRKAAGQGDVTAQAWLGLLYADGRGVPRDFAQSICWYRKAADQGDLESQQHLGLLYYEGEQVEHNYPEAYFWLEIHSQRVSRGHTNYAGYRCSAAAEHLTPDQLADAQIRVKEWLAAHPPLL